MMRVLFEECSCPAIHCMSAGLHCINLTLHSCVLVSVKTKTTCNEVLCYYLYREDYLYKEEKQL